MAFILNVIWVVFGGFIMGFLWLFTGCVAALSIIGLPWARACFAIASFTFWPFGREAVNRAVLTGQEDIGTGPWGLIGNVLWALLFGIWLAIGHVGAALACAVTIIGIPFAIQHLKLVPISLMPIGMTVVDKAQLRRV